MNIEQRIEQIIRETCHFSASDGKCLNHERCPRETVPCSWAKEQTLAILAALSEQPAEGELISKQQINKIHERYKRETQTSTYTDIVPMIEALLAAQYAHDKARLKEPPSIEWFNENFLKISLHLFGNEVEELRQALKAYYEG